MNNKPDKIPDNWRSKDIFMQYNLNMLYLWSLDQFMGFLQDVDKGSVHKFEEYGSMIWSWHFVKHNRKKTTTYKH